MPTETDVETDIHFKSIIFIVNLVMKPKIFRQNWELLFLIQNI